MSNAYTLNLFDKPGVSSCQVNNSCMSLTTQLVGICEAPSQSCTSPRPFPYPSGPLFQLTWETNFNGGKTGGIYEEGISFFPSDPGSGAGGLTLTSINGVQLPPAVSPSQVSTTASGLAYSRVSQTFDGTVTITNISSGAISGPIQILLMGMPAGVTLTNSSGNLFGTPYLTVPSAAGLAPGQSASVNVRFKSSSSASIKFTPEVYSGSI